MTGRAPARVGTRIRKLRVEKGLSQRDLAEPEMSGAYLSLVESGQRSPSLEALSHIATKLGVDVDELRTGVPKELPVELELELQEARGSSHRGAVQEAEAQVQRILAKARRHRLGRVTARALCVLGAIEVKRGSIEKAQELYKNAGDTLHDEAPHVRYEAVVGHARCTRSLGETRLAAYELETYLAELDETGIDDPTAKMRVNAVLVQIYRSLGLEGKSLVAAEQAMRLGSYVEDPEQVACMNMNVARALLDQGRHDDALAALRDAERIYQSLDWPLPAARAKVNAGIVALGKNRLDMAHTMFTDAITAFETHRDETTEFVAALNLLGRTERLRGNIDDAIGYLRRARKLLPRDDAYERAMNWYEMGLCLAESDPAAGEQELRHAADSYEAAGAHPDAARVMLELGRLMLGRGDSAGAAKIMERGLELTAATGP